MSLLRDRLREACPDAFTDAYLLGELNVAQAVVVTKTRCLVATATTPTVPHQAEYAWPTDAVAILAATCDGTRLTEEALETILDSGAAEGAPRAFAVLGGEITLYPTPAEAGTLRVYYVRKPTPLDSDTLDAASDLPDEWAEAAITLALGNVLLAKGDPQAQAHFARFEQACAERVRNTFRALPDRVGLVRRR